MQAVAADDGAGVSNRTLRRRLSRSRGTYLLARGDVAKNPVPRGLPTRRERSRPQHGVPMVRSTRTVPRILTLPTLSLHMSMIGAGARQGVTVEATDSDERSAEKNKIQLGLR